MSTNNDIDENQRVKKVAAKPKITKEEMKREMLEHNYFDTEIIFDGMKNERTDDHKRSEKDLLDEATVKEIIE